MEETTRLYSIDDAAGLLGRSPLALRQLIRRGHVPVARQLGGRTVFLKGEFDGWLAGLPRQGGTDRAGRPRKPPPRPPATLLRHWIEAVAPEPEAVAPEPEPAP